MTLASPLKTVSQSGSVLIRYGGGVSQFFTAKINGDVFLTAAITYQGETNVEDVDLVASGERVDGIVYATAFPMTVNLEKDSDDQIEDDDETYVWCYKPIAQDLLYATVTTATSIGKDDWVKYTDGFLLAATNKNDAIGRLDNGGVAVTGVSATEQIVPILWGTD